ncbi:MAG: S-adenosyl-l-methionine hydroxide adenosyltransferase family protein [Alphaproteobacteria bacterium]
MQALIARAAAPIAAAVAFAMAAAGAMAQDTIGIVVYQTDFGLKDGAVSEMKGVAVGVDPTLRLEDLTHEIPAFDIWEAAYRLNQTVPYWPAGTVFVSVVDPGVGTDRKSVVARLDSGHYVVTPDNGTLTLLADSLGLAEVREIDEASNRLPGSEDSFTFHGRDVYSYTAARLASGTIGFEQVGPSLGTAHEAIAYQQPAFADGVLSGTVPVLDVQYGNVWTNIDMATFDRLGAALGDVLNVAIAHEGTQVYQGAIPYVTTFGDVPEGDPLIYFNSLGNLSFALNYDDFAGTFGIESGPAWSVTVSK